VPALTDDNANYQYALRNSQNTMNNTMTTMMSLNQISGDMTNDHASITNLVSVFNSITGRLEGIQANGGSTANAQQQAMKQRQLQMLPVQLQAQQIANQQRQQDAEMIQKMQFFGPQAPAPTVGNGAFDEF
jgi:P-type conjugative transfer protein TrbJ